MFYLEDYDSIDEMTMREMLGEKYIGDDRVRNEFSDCSIGDMLDEIRRLRNYLTMMQMYVQGVSIHAVEEGHILQHEVLVVTDLLEAAGEWAFGLDGHTVMDIGDTISQNDLDNFTDGDIEITEI